MLALLDKLNPKRNAAAPGELAETFYGEMGRYARVVDPFPGPRVAEESQVPPRFDPPAPLGIHLAEGCRWATSADLRDSLAVIGRPGPASAGGRHFDADGDGKLDLYLTAAVLGPKGVRDALLVNRGDGKFEDLTLAFGLPETGRASASRRGTSTPIARSTSS